MDTIICTFVCSFAHALHLLDSIFNFIGHGPRRTLQNLGQFKIRFGQEFMGSSHSSIIVEYHLKRNIHGATANVNKENVRPMSLTGMMNTDVWCTAIKEQSARQAREKWQIRMSISGEMRENRDNTSATFPGVNHIQIYCLTRRFSPIPFHSNDHR